MASALNNNNTSSVVKKPIGVVVIAVILIISSLQQMTALFSYEWYRHNFSYMPGWLITARYCFSWFQRIVGITAAVGLLNLKDFFRKLTMWLGWFTITTVYWKHPYSGFEKASIDLQGKLSQ